MRLTIEQPPYELTYSDVFLVPQYSDIESRLDVDMSSPDGTSTIPLVVANMNAVAGRRMAEVTARRGGVTVLPQDMPAEAVARAVASVQAAHPLFESALVMSPSDTVSDALAIIHKLSHGAVIVVDDQQRPLGIFTEHDGVGLDRFTPIVNAMRTDVVSVKEGASVTELFEELHRQRLSVAPVVRHDGKLAGVVTPTGLVRSNLYRPNVNADGQLRVAAAVGINGDVAGRTAELVALGVDIIVVDTAHGHQKKMLDAVKTARSTAPNAIIVAGNIVTAEGTKAILDQGANVVKVGVGPGAMCTTRVMTGVGRPQFSAVLECATEARKHGGHVWADGGVRHPRDVALALAAGASSVMLGSLLAGTYESATDLIIDGSGRAYKENYGMASRRAVAGRTRTDKAMDQARKALFEEGISNSRYYLDPERPGVENLIDQIIAGVRSAFTYAGARSVPEFWDRALVGVQSAAGFSEGLPRPTNG
jgi:IMP dehydrogenase